MHPLHSPSNVAQQIASTQEAIDASNHRLHELRQDLGASARHSLSKSRKPLLIGGIALLAVGVLLYPKRHVIIHGARRLGRHPVVHALLQNLPLIGMALPWLTRRDKAP
jgi:hypothetical protein